VLNFVKDIKK